MEVVREDGFRSHSFRETEGLASEWFERRKVLDLCGTLSWWIELNREQGIQGLGV